MTANELDCTQLAQSIIVDCNGHKVPIVQLQTVVRLDSQPRPAGTNYRQTLARLFDEKIVGCLEETRTTILELHRAALAQQRQQMLELIKEIDLQVRYGSLPSIAQSQCMIQKIVLATRHMSPGVIDLTEQVVANLMPTGDWTLLEAAQKRQGVRDQVKAPQSLEKVISDGADEDGIYSYFELPYFHAIGTLAEVEVLIATRVDDERLLAKHNRTVNGQKVAKAYLLDSLDRVDAAPLASAVSRLHDLRDKVDDQLENMAKLLK